MKLKKTIFMLFKIISDITSTKEPYKIAYDVQSENLREYYFLFEENPRKLNKLITDFDKYGIPVNNAYIDVAKPKTHYYPITIGQYGLAVFHTYLKTKSAQKRNHFLRIADWFYANRIEDSKLGTFWLTDIPKPEYNIRVPWKSAFAQSRAISVLLRAWQITGDKKYLQTASSSLIPYTFDYNNGGVSAFTKHGKFYEEYVATEPTMVLDGHIFSMLGLYDYFRAVPKNIELSYNKLAKNLFDEGVISLINWLPEYDLGYWLRFNMCRMSHYPDIDPCTIGYFRLVCLQLKLLLKITGKQEIKNFLEKIKNYDNAKNIIRMYPVKYKALKQLNRL
ncbi:MAG: hypothetical protein JW995_00075 [Melioribacteraceae bacterium]|nr:hypothetical protein [Melioribacteraceae bacterium]